MSVQNEYKHITVVAPDDDDIIIQAGASEKGDAPALQSEVAPSSSTERSEAVSSEVPNQNIEYHATTLEDIKSSKMPKAQIVIIVLAIIAIAAFIIWNVVAR